MIAICEECKVESEVQAFHPTKRKIKFCSFRCGKNYLKKKPAGRMTAKEKKKLEDERPAVVGGLRGF
jgi:hypothetical protein